MGAIAWGFRFAAQAATGNKPYFRDMPFGVAYGYVLGAGVLAWLIWAYLQAGNPDAAIANTGEPWKLNKRFELREEKSIA